MFWRFASVSPQPKSRAKPRDLPAFSTQLSAFSPLGNWQLAFGREELFWPLPEIQQLAITIQTREGIWRLASDREELTPPFQHSASVFHA
jgi:hypothetical protein